MTAVPMYATDQASAMTAIGVDEEEWKTLKSMPGFPPRKPKGWDLEKIDTWLSDERLATAAAAVDIAASDVEPSVRTIRIELPLCPPSDGSYIASQIGRLNTRLNRESELAAFRQVHAGLRAMNATFADGRPVDTAPDVVRYLFALIQKKMTS